MMGITLQVKNAMFEYGRHLGLAFQIVDDILDFTTATEQLGKPQVRFSCLLMASIQTLPFPHFCSLHFWNLIP